jgi:hypothetical protein
MRLCEPFFAYFSRPKTGAGWGGVDFINYEKAIFPVDFLDASTRRIYNRLNRKNAPR